MDEYFIQLIEEGLNKLISKYKKNLDPDDGYRLQATIDAKSAIRRVGLRIAINGDILDIYPILDKNKGAGWEIIDKNNQIIQYFKR